MSSLGGMLQQLGELDQDNVGSWPTWVYTVAVMLVAAIILGAGTWYFVLPKQDELQRAQQQEQELRQTFTQKHKQVASLDQYKEQLATMREQFAEQLDQLPTESEIPSLLRDISKLRQANDLGEKLFRPRAAENRDFYLNLPNAMTITGSYHQLANFVSDVAALQRIVTLGDIKIQPLREDGAEQLQMSMTVNTYRYIGDGDDEE
ncbi:MAG TPA: type 4a pilus biogenesis protein PilO [Salinisphaeraceae bacterium]|nr:type 4a pilus biogenesis protein PilO [Salinisphaeraceae bacterium]